MSEPETTELLVASLLGENEELKEKLSAAQRHIAIADKRCAALQSRKDALQTELAAVRDAWRRSLGEITACVAKAAEQPILGPVQKKPKT